ncbi:hypothetical protein RHSIM_Rhsim09G0084000 [Rhododendron simsii]|uniref:Trimethylguanosine synthase n=1 Tax=Rhododendron simsii TaxID=118357 RepID=A0A834LDX6_RHOSS|nr:hypothetical protein RHSIM_Rhsim09G0084000 [Rhododendron simsii]
MNLCSLLNVRAFVQFISRNLIQVRLVLINLFVMIILRCYHVVAIDIDSQKVEMALSNAKVCGVEDYVDFIVGDFIQLAPSLKHTHMEVRYTDVDFLVFSDAASLMASRKSPCERTTYRYSPLIAFLLIPNSMIHRSWGKFLFSASADKDKEFFEDKLLSSALAIDNLHDQMKTLSLKLKSLEETVRNFMNVSEKKLKELSIEKDEVEKSFRNEQCKAANLINEKETNELQVVNKELDNTNIELWKGQEFATADMAVQEMERNCDQKLAEHKEESQQYLMHIQEEHAALSVAGMKFIYNVLVQATNKPEDCAMDDIVKDADRLVSCLANKYAVKESTLNSLVTELLLLLLDERVPRMDGGQLLKALNVLMFKILQPAILKIAIVKDADRLVSCLANKVAKTFDFSIGGASSRHFKINADAVKESTLNSLVTELLLLDERVPRMDDDGQLLKALNVLMLKILTLWTILATQYVVALVSYVGSFLLMAWMGCVADEFGPFIFAVPLLLRLEHAFAASPYPVIITLADHLTPDIQAKEAQMPAQTFGKMFHPESELTEFPLPEDLKYHFLSLTKPPKEYLEAQSFKKNDPRVYPKGTWFNSSNYKPQISRMHGAQMVAFNMQHLHVHKFYFQKGI